ncbi:GNAT family N-acetyltransferase [Arthrobacter sp. ISL-72]|uniref:GNAT family N-acetyltransferase n=1 Tax=Arthrobacter sp. ISL-72 TaxID=2819114 RepID=UPI001BECC6F3|nr:GNAT family N-acetyltransferase [Arthrobacter sp. ISL-72]MBT2594489.1 GNAT family N-acetyltransferase [Arthrobacter sp. ISL-72]
MPTAPYVIEPLVLPVAIDAPDAGEFLEFGALSDALVLETWSNPDRTSPPGARLEYWRESPYSQLRLFYVRQDGRMVARSWIRLALQDNVHTAILRVDVLKAYSGRGIGRTLLAHAEEVAAARGRTTLQSFTEHPADFAADGPGLLRPGTGSGVLPSDARSVRFALKAGYRLEQVSRFSSLTLPPDGDALDRLEQEAAERAGERYELLHWTDTCPDEYVDQLAVLMSRMITDSPAGGLSYDEEAWDAARVRHVENKWKKAGQDSLVACARHRETGELAAYSVLQVSPAKPWIANQDDTLVASYHRGHRLGMLVKILNLRRLLAGYPDVERITTFNAAENDHMLSINVALGFRPAGYDGEWQKSV